jgi:hypothetical protein
MQKCAISRGIKERAVTQEAVSWHVKTREAGWFLVVLGLL